MEIDFHADEIRLRQAMAGQGGVAAVALPPQSKMPRIGHVAFEEAGVAGWRGESGGTCVRPPATAVQALREYESE